MAGGMGGMGGNPFGGGGQNPFSKEKLEALKSNPKIAAHLTDVNFRNLYDMCC